MKKSKLLLLAIGNASFLIGTLIVNTLSATLPLNGKTPGELSDMYPNLFVPDGMTFSIWGVIYILLLANSVYQFFTLKIKDNHIVKKTGIWFMLSCVFNISWIFFWHYELVLLSVITIVLLLISLLVLYDRLGISERSVGRTEKILSWLPVSIYLGWISVAVIANITSALVKFQWNGWGIASETWLVILLLTAAGLALYYIFRKKDIAYSLVTLWALFGIWFKQVNLLGNPALIVRLSLFVLMSVITLSIFYQLFRRKVYTN